MRKNISGERIHYRSFWLLGLLMMVLLGVTSLFAMYTTNHVAKSMEENLSISLTSDAQGKADAINLWLATITGEVGRFVDKDMIRLFCAESILKAQGNTSTSHLVQLEGIQETRGELKNIQNLITTQLQELLESENFFAGGIWDANLKSLLHTKELEDKLPQGKEALLEKSLNSGKVVFSSIHNDLEGLMLTIVFPIFPPEYTELPADRAVAALVLDVPIEAPLSKIINPMVSITAPVEIYRLFQWTEQNNVLQYINLKNGDIIAFPDWKTPRNEMLPLMKRSVPDEDSVYSLGVPIDNHNILVTHEEPAHIAEDFYFNFRNFMIIFVAGAIIVTGLLLWGCWWFFVGRHERAVEANMRKLSEDVNTQQQIIDSINATLTDGVVLTDTLGNILYSNTSFAKMVHHNNPEDLRGSKMGSILHPDAAEMLQEHFDKVVKTEQQVDFESKLTIHRREVYWQGIYTPYFEDEDHISGVVAVYRDTTKIMKEREIEQSRIEQLINVLTMSVGLVSPYLRGHCIHTSELSKSLAEILHLSKDDQKTITFAAALSQMGMISLPKSVLNKKGALTEEERKIMQTHVIKTCDILADFDFGLPVQETILQMNENMDGSGYPRKLKGNEISMLSRILHVANAFCAILRPRAYRQARSLNETIAILDKESHIYDTVVLKALKTYTISPDGRIFVSKLQNTNIKE